MLKYIVVGFALLLAGVAASAQPADDLTGKQIAMLAAEAQFFSTLARQQKDELDKLKATPCKPEGGDR